MQTYYDNQRARAQVGTGIVRLALSGLLLLAAARTVAAGPIFDQAIEAFRYNKTDEAISLFQTAIENEPQAETAYRYLGIAFEQARQADRAESAYQRGLQAATVSSREKARIAAQLASMYQRLGRKQEALNAYSTAVQHDGTLAAAYLNRANVKVNLEQFESAVNDYRTYLTVKPQSSQRPQVEQMISLLSTEIEEREAAEQARREAEEERRRVEEERRRREEEQRQLLLNSVLNSLNTATEETENLEAESEEIQSYDEDLDIID